MNLREIGSLSARRLRFYLNRLRERLWVKPLVVCFLSIGAVFLAKLADREGFAEFLPSVTAESMEMLLSIMASSMLVIATFSVASMVSAYASAGRTATPRTFSLVVSDDLSQNALSTFIGGFIFAIVALTAAKNEFFGSAGLFVLFVLTVGVLALVVLTFVRWVDRIARLGRMGWTIDKVEQATAAALRQRRAEPGLGARFGQPDASGTPVRTSAVGYVQQIDMEALQKWAEEHDARVSVAAPPGTFVSPDRPLAFVSGGGEEPKGVAEAFQVGDDRVYDEDARFGFVVLSEIAARALSPAVNDPGTAIDIIGTLVRLFALWAEPVSEGEVRFDRVAMPRLQEDDLFDDAFTAVAREGAGTVEVAVRLQKALTTLAALGPPAMRSAAERHASLALERARLTMTLEADLEAVRRASGFAGDR